MINGDIVAHLQRRPALKKLIPRSKMYTSHTEPARLRPPYIVVTEIASVHHQHAGGISGLASGRYEVEVVHVGYEKTKDAAEQVRLAMSGVGETTWGDTFISGCLLDTIRDEDPPDDFGRGVRVKVLEFDVSYAEATS